jgi:hypothetical protein
MAESCALSYRQLAWATEWYLGDEQLQAANDVLVDYLHQLQLAAHWGTGEFSSSDGQRSAARRRAAAGDPLAREVGYRGALNLVNWVSDKSSARSRRPASAVASIGSISRASGSVSSGLARRSGAMPRRIPESTAATAPESHGLGWSWARWAAAIAAARRAIGDRAKLAVGLGGEERGDGRRRRRDRAAPVRGAPVGERPPVALIRPPRGGRERRGGIRGGAFEAALELVRRRGPRGVPEGVDCGWCRSRLGSGKPSRYLFDNRRETPPCLGDRSATLHGAPEKALRHVAKPSRIALSAVTGSRYPTRFATAPPTDRSRTQRSATPPALRPVFCTSPPRTPASAPPLSWASAGKTIGDPLEVSATAAPRVGPRRGGR